MDSGTPMTAVADEHRKESWTRKRSPKSSSIPVQKERALTQEISWSLARQPSGKANAGAAASQHDRSWLPDRGAARR